MANKLFMYLGILCCLLIACQNRASKDLSSHHATDSVYFSDSINALLPDSIEVPDSQLTTADTLSFGSFKSKGTYIYISKKNMKLYVVSNADSVLFSCGIACGIRKGDKQSVGDYRTPEGRFTVCGIFNSTDWIHKTRDGRKVKGCYGPIFLSLYNGKFNGIGIHGTNAPRSIGKRASEGCIRVQTPNILIINNRYAYVGMSVYISHEKEEMPGFAGLTHTPEKTVICESNDTCIKNSTPIVPDTFLSPTSVDSLVPDIAQLASF